jgi:capsular polysaccharide biosynthesis protein
MKNTVRQRLLSARYDVRFSDRFGALCRAIAAPAAGVLGLLASTSSRHPLAHLTKVTTVPVAELSSAFQASNNSGAYQRCCETLIVGPDWICSDISMRSKETVTPLPFGVAHIHQAIVCGEGIIWKNPQNGPCAATETLINAVTPRSIFPLQRAPDGGLSVNTKICGRRLPKDQVYAFLRQPFDNNYGHWLIEVLPKVGILADHFDLESLKFIVTQHKITRKSYPMRKVYFDSLAAFGIKPQQIVEMGREAVEVEHLLYPLPLAVHPWVKAPRAIEILEGLRDRIAGEARGPRRLYVSRAHAPKRHLLNEAEILAVLKNFDVTIVYPERLSFSEQVRLFAHAELVIGNYGANLTNAVFAPRGIKLFAITSEAMSDDFFWDMINLKSGKYFSLHGKPVSENAHQNSDFLIDPEAFRRLLETYVLR